MADSKVITRNDVQNILAHINLGDDSHQEITQADFDALSDEEKNSGTIYFITNGINNNIFLDDNTPIGTIAPYGGSSDPAYWLICDGRAVSRIAYADLFTVIGTTYGEGDGETTFNIPDLRGRIAQGSGTIDNETYVLGDEVDAGLPNITGGATNLGHTAGVTYGITTSDSGWFGAMKSKNGTNCQSVAGGTSYTAAQKNSGFELDASRSSSIYGNSTTVQPNTVITNYIIKYSSAISQNQSQLDFIYPVGSYYETTSSNFNPASNWGGTWELVDEYELVAWASVTNNVITASHNMSITGLGGTAYYTITFTKPMANTDYLVSASGEASGIGSEILGVYQKTTNGFYFDHANYSGTAVVLLHFTITVFGKLAEPEHFKWHRVA